MKFFKIVALFALAALPLLLVKKEKEEQESARDVDSDDIFDRELSVD